MDQKNGSGTHVGIERRCSCLDQANLSWYVCSHPDSFPSRPREKRLPGYGYNPFGSCSFDPTNFPPLLSYTHTSFGSALYWIRTILDPRYNGSALYWIRAILDPHYIWSALYWIRDVLEWVSYWICLSTDRHNDILVFFIIGLANIGHYHK